MIIGPKVVDEEIESIEKNDTWFFVELPKYNNLIDVKWVYKKNLNEVEGHEDKVYKLNKTFCGLKEARRA